MFPGCTEGGVCVMAERFGQTAVCIVEGSIGLNLFSQDLTAQKVY